MKETNSSALGSLPRLRATLLAALIALGLFTVQAGLVSADPGATTSGDATASNDATVIQKNIQVIAGQHDEGQNTQVATNNATINQAAIAESGDATASGGGSASSGNATAYNRAVVVQMNIQVIAGINCNATQVAHNDATINQAAVATSGDANSTGGGTAVSGNATAGNLAVVNQMNKQTHVCTPNASSGPSYQYAANNATVNQAAIAASGDANSTGGGNASSGDSTAKNRLWSNQRNHQRIFN